jgi:nitric oxide reductase subunit C
LNKRQSRVFAIACTAIATLVFLALTVDSHRKFPELTNAENITPEVSAGMDVWHANNCINCHTLFGEGAYYAPDLTKITQLRGEQYLAAYMRDPASFYDENLHRRLMPKQDLSDVDITNLIAFLEWVANVDNQGWPPRPILVTGSAIPGMAMSFEQRTGAPTGSEEAASQVRTVSSGDSPVARGEVLFNSVTPTCSACHSIAPGQNMAGPSLAGVFARAEASVGSSEYSGSATDAAGHLKESILSPSVDIVPGGTYSANGASFMPNTYADSLTPDQIDALVSYLATLR